MITLTYSDARARFASLLKKAVDDRETVIIERRGAPSAALIAADELESLTETAYLLRSPRNAQRLLSALQGALEHRGEVKTVDELRAEFGLEEESE